MHSVIILNQGDSRFNFFLAYENINSQIIIKSGPYKYNFNADVATSLIGICQRSDKLLQLLGCEIGRKYKREITLDPPQLTIYPEEEGRVSPHKQPRREYVNDINEISLTVEN